MNEMNNERDENILALQMFELPNELDFECVSFTSTCASMQSIC